MEILPVKLLKDAIRAVPALRYALGVVGIVSVIAIVKMLNVDFELAIFGTIVIVALMILLLVFSTIADKKNKASLRILGLIFSWAVMILITLIVILLPVEYFAHWPFDIFKAPSITVSGIVMDESKEPIVGAEVSDDASSAYTTSRSDGQYILVFPKAKKGGRLSFLVYHEGYRAEQVTLAVDENSIQKNIVLEKKRRPKP